MFTIGADPELFIKNSSGFISAVGKIGGTKQHPLPISKDGHCVQEDNVSVEFNIPPSNNAEAFVKNINYVLAYLKERVGEMKLEFATNVASASFPVKELCTPEAQTFGCEPDFNAYTLQPNPRPFCEDETLRSCGGHVHVGTDVDRIQLVRAMDYFLGVPSVLMDKDTKRRNLYGKAGAFRMKPFGVEYRTLSNFWIWEDKYINWVYNQTAKAVAAVKAGERFDSSTFVELVPNTINCGEINVAKSMVSNDSRIRPV